MLKKLISALLFLICILSLVACATGNGGGKPSLPPVTTVGLPKKETVSTNYESEGFVINIYQTYAEIVEYKGKEAEVTVPDSFMGLPVKSLCEYAFFGNETLTKVTLPDQLIVIGKGAFQDCSALTEVVLGDHVEVISQAAFRDSALEKINLPDTIAEIDRYAFYRTHITELKLPASLTTVMKYAFYGCEYLTTVQFSERIETVSEYAFAACKSLTSVVITDRVETLGDYVFSDCTALSKIFIPKKTMIGENPFLGCPSITIYSPSGSRAKGVADRYGYAFTECKSADKMP